MLKGLPLSINNKFMIQCIPAKPTSSKQVRLSRPATQMQSNHPVFPFQNTKLKQKGWEDQCLEMRPFKSRAQISRRKLQSIPLLKNIRLGNDKLSIFRSAKNEYNVYVKKQHKETFNNQILVINGESKASHQKNRISNDQKMQRGVTLDSWKCKSLTMFGGCSSFENNYISSSFYASQKSLLNIEGKRKSMQLYKVDRRSTPVPQYHQIKF